MNSLKLIFLILISSVTLAKFGSKSQPLYHCVNYDGQSKVTDAMIYESQYGRGPIFHEIEVYVEDTNQNKEFSYRKKVNYIPKYDAKVESFTTGSFRIRLDHVVGGIDGNIWAFVRIPEYDIHSFDWSCKAVEGQ
ncbi:hypothetical protein ABMA70_14145 [Halobacteriovorax sp. XZX-3]|uniref:hypothetical protein n=1 Tax=unclassified Halobacteriovorax TaxID=2639665 RepID=UPI0037234274